MSDLYSDSSVVPKANGAPTATAHPTAISGALPVAFWWTANDALMPAPFTFLPWTYSLRTEGPMPLGAISTTLTSGRKSAPSERMTPSRKPCERPRVAPGFIAASRRV